jgi:ketosteroid isomerase-like protein
MKNLLSVFFFFVLFLAACNFSQAQQWSAEQQDLWKGVQTYWEAGMASDPANMLSYWDDSYYGWSYENGAPGTKGDVTKAFNYWFKKGKVQYYTITPARIWVNGNFGYVHYYFTTVTESSDGKPMTERGRWTDILMKKDGKWMLVGDHGGEMKDD